MIAGVELYVGQMVFVLGVGMVPVIQVLSDGGFVVKSGNDRMQFTAGGYLGRTRRVFLNDPMLVEPWEDADAWREFVKCVRAQAAAWSKMLRQGGMEAPETTETEETVPAVTVKKATKTKK